MNQMMNEQCKIFLMFLKVFYYFENFDEIYCSLICIYCLFGGFFECLDVCFLGQLLIYLRFDFEVFEFLV